MKGFFKFITLLVIVLVVYFAIMFQMDYFIVNHNGELKRQLNPYYKYKDNESVFYKLSALYDTREEVSDQHIEVIQNNKIIKNILTEIEGVKENQIDKYIKKLRKEGEIYLVESNIFYIATGSYGFAFSMDGNHIAYELIKEYDNNKYWTAKKITQKDKNEIYQKIQKELERLGITEKFEFEPETIYIKYYNGILTDWDGEIYVVEDTKHHIKIEMELPSYQIINMQIGFEYFMPRA